MLIFDHKMSSASIVPAFIRQLQLCAVQPSETVIFLTDASSPREFVDAGVAACGAIGCASYEVNIGRGHDSRLVGANPLASPGLLEAFKQADLVISFMIGFFTPWERAVRAAGGRILNILDVPNTVIQLQGG